MVRTTPLRFHNYEWTPDRPESWQDRASCSGKSHLFDLIDKEGEGNDDEIKSLNLVNFARAEKICASCPVFFECESSGTLEDFAHTYRAGRYPTAFSPRGPGRPRRATLEDLSKKVCPNGHVGQYRMDKSSGYPKCGQCRRDQQNAKRRSLGIEERPKNRTHCSKGHNDWAVKGNGERRCKECRRQYERDRYIPKSARIGA